MFSLHFRSISRHSGRYLPCATIVPNHGACEATDKPTANFVPEAFEHQIPQIIKNILKLQASDSVVMVVYVCTEYFCSKDFLFFRNSYLKLTVMKSKMCLPSQHIGLQKPLLPFPIWYFEGCTCNELSNPRAISH